MRFIFSILFTISTLYGFCQNIKVGKKDSLYIKIDTVDEKKIKKKSVQFNNIKINLYSLFVRNYSFYFERSISRKITAQIGFRYQPYSYLLDNVVAKQLLKDKIVQSDLYDFKTSNSSFTLDLKYYPGKKGAGKGFYIGIYGRYTILDLDDVDYVYQSKSDDIYHVPLFSRLKGIGGGILLGYQFLIKKRISVDIYIIGGHYGIWNGSINSKKDLFGLSDDEKTDLKEKIENLYTLFGRKYANVNVSNIGVSGNISGPFWGTRSGISLGISF